MSNFSRSSMRDTSHSRRSDSVTRPMLPLKGTAIAWPTWITSRAGGSSPHGAVMIRTSCPMSRRRSYVSRMCAFAPPGRGYAYGRHDPDLHSSLLICLLARFTGSRTIERHCCCATPSRCSPSVQCRPSGRVVRPSIARRSAAPSFAVEVGPGRPHQLRVMRVARARLGDVQDLLVEPDRAGAADAARVRRIARLDAVDVHERIGRGRERSQRALADGEREVGKGMRHDRDAAGVVDVRDRRRERREHRDLVLDPQREQVTGPRRDLDAGDDLHRARAARRDVAQHECAADVVVIGQRDDVEPDALRRVEDGLRRCEPVAEVGVQLKVSASHARNPRRPSTPPVPSHVALEHAREPLHAFSHVGLSVAGARDARAAARTSRSARLAPPGERRQSGAPVRIDRTTAADRQQRRAPEELDALADAGDRPVGEDAEHLPFPQHAEDAPVTNRCG